MRGRGRQGVLLTAAMTISLAAAAAGAMAGTPLAPPGPDAWETSPEVPFTSDELRQAVAARGSRGIESCTFISATFVGGATLVRCGGRSRAVQLGDRRGPEAARAVAIVLLELAASPQAPAAGRRAQQPAASPLAWDARGRLVGISAFGVAADDISQLGVGLGADLGVRGWRAGVDLCADYSARNRSEPTPTFQRITTRLSATRQLKSWSVGAGAFGSATWISRTAHRYAFLWGAGALAQWQAEVITGHWLFFESSLAVFPHRINIVLDTSQLASTPRVQLSFHLGYQWRFAGG